MKEIAKTKIKRKTRIRQRLLIGFMSVLFFSSALTWVGINIGIRVLGVGNHRAAIGEYADIIGSGVEGRIGIISTTSIVVMFLVSVVVTYFLSNSITKPIEQISEFAKSMGMGKFETNSLDFMDTELDELNTSLNKSITRLGAYDSSQKDFFQNASHELRTPLMSIKVYAEGITYDIMDPKQAANTILEETDRLSELVTDLLYIAKVDSSATEYKIDKLDICDLLEKCTKRQEALAGRKNIIFELDLDKNGIIYEGSKELLSRSIDNLVSNAIRYAKSKVVVSCEQTDYDIRITVQDDGNGIDDEALPHVFERFYKGVGGNTGIGLSIVKSIVEQHSGYVQVQNTKDSGASFSIILPKNIGWRK